MLAVQLPCVPLHSPQIALEIVQTINFESCHIVTSFRGDDNTTSKIVNPTRVTGMRTINTHINHVSLYLYVQGGQKEKGGPQMNEMEKKIAQNIEAAMQCLPEEKRQYFLGFAEGVAAMAAQLQPQGAA